MNLDLAINPVIPWPVMAGICVVLLILKRKGWLNFLRQLGLCCPSLDTHNFYIDFHIVLDHDPCSFDSQTAIAHKRPAKLCQALKRRKTALFFDNEGELFPDSRQP